VRDDLAAVAARLVDEAEDLDAEHGEDAGHEVQDEAAEEGQQQSSGQAGTCRWQLRAES
jgi:hypothetical protein